MWDAAARCRAVWAAASNRATTGREPQMPAERAAIVTGASSGIGLAIARVLGEEGYGVTMAARRPEKLDAAVAGLAADGLRRARLSPRTSPMRRRSSRSSPRTASATAALDVLVNNAGVGVGAGGRRYRDQAAGHAARHQPALDRALLPRVRAAAEGGRRRAQERARRQHLLDLRQARRGVAVGLLRHQARRRRLDRSDEQGARRRGHQVAPRCAPRSWTRR